VSAAKEHRSHSAILPDREILRPDGLGIRAGFTNETSSSPVTPGKIVVLPAKLDEELERIRREAAQLDRNRELKESGAAAPRLRTTLANLIMFVSRHGWSVADQTIDQLITELCVSHPSRFFVVTYACDGVAARCLCEGKVQTAVSSRCVLTNSGTHVCSEEVYINVRPKSLPVVSNLLLSLLVPHVSTVIMMLCDPARKLLNCWHEHAEARYVALVRSIARECNLLVYDSLLFDDYSESISALFHEDASSLLPSAGLSHYDLNWERTDKWRALTAEQFDAERLSSAAGNILELRFISFRRVGTGGQTSVAAEAFLLAGWFMARLGWNEISASAPQSGKEMEVCCSAAGNVKPLIRFVEMEQTDVVNSAACLSAVEIVLEAENDKLRIRLEQLAGQEAIKVSTGKLTADGVSELLVRRVPFVRQPLEKLIVSNLRSHGGNRAQSRDKEYLEALIKAASISKLVSQCR
jgi:glucose-6-phosphate dehydrogenase assembly protein OpcA